MKEISDVIRDVKKEGGKVINNVVVKNINCKSMNTYDRVALTVNKDIPHFEADENGGSVESTTRVIFASSYSIGAVLSEGQDTAFIKNYILDNPELLEILMSYATVDLLLEKVEEGETYVNPFSSNGTEREVANTQWYVHVTGIEFSDFGLESLKEIRSELMHDAIAKAKAKREKRRGRRTTTRTVVETTEEVVEDADDAEDTTEEVTDAPATKTTKKNK